jgi:hypothetical protein
LSCFTNYIFANSLVSSHGVKEIFFCQREGEKFKNSLASDLQALCQSLGLESACTALAMCLQIPFI